MTSLLGLVRGRQDRQAQVKSDSDEFQKKYTGDLERNAPVERGAEEDSFVPSQEKELASQGWLMGAAPSEAPTANAVETSKAGSSVLQKMRAAGVPEQTLNEAAEGMRTNGQHTFLDPRGKPVLTVGEHDALGQELLNHGRSMQSAAEEAAPSINYSKERIGFDATPLGASKGPRMSGEAADFFKRTGVDPTRKSALQAMQELRARGK